MQKIHSGFGRGLLLEIAGSPCVGFTTMGAVWGFLDTSCLAFLAWIYIMRSVRPHIIIHECTKGFPHQDLDMLLNEGFDVRYIIESIVTCMTDVCVSQSSVNVATQFVDCRV